METESLEESIKTYECQLAQVKLAISASEEGWDKDNLISLKNDLEELIQLTKENLNQVKSSSPSTSSSENTSLDDEFAMFMSEMEKVGAVPSSNKTENKESNIEEELKALEGMKCRAPHVHQWGETMYHNALVCSVIALDNYKSINDIEVKVMFINPTHEEMLPCPYLLESSCKFDDEKCKYSHGEIVAFSSLQEYIEPKFELLTIGSKVLAKQSNKLWHRAIVKRLYNERCLVKFDSSQKDLELELHEVLPLENDSEQSSSEDESSAESDEQKRQDVINMSLMNTPSSAALGDWEKYTKGIGSKLMQKMGYVVGTGLGKDSAGRLDPIAAVVLPPGKSLDHCMNLRERAGGDKDLFSVERKLKRLQKKQEIQNEKAYAREKKKVDVFNFLNKTLSKMNAEEELNIKKSKHRKEIKNESSRNLNVAQMKIEEEIKRVERDMYKIRESLKRHSDVRTQMNKNLKEKLQNKQFELRSLKVQAVNIAQEQSIRNDKKKMMVF